MLKSMSLTMWGRLSSARAFSPLETDGPMNVAFAYCQH